MVFNSVLMVILSLIVVGINVTIFFLVIRAVIIWKNVSFFRGFDVAGKSLVDTYTRFIERLWSRFTQKHLTLKGNLLIGLILLELAKLFVVRLVRLL